MTAVLGDFNLEGHVRSLIALLRAEGWGDLWDGLALEELTFARLGLPGATPDDVLWRLCQREGIVLVTANRNADGPDSLQAVIRAENTPASLPVITVADAGRVVRDRDYAARVAVELLDRLLRIDDLRGAGRLYVP